MNPNQRPQQPYTWNWQTASQTQSMPHPHNIYNYPNMQPYNFQNNIQFQQTHNVPNVPVYNTTTQTNAATFHNNFSFHAARPTLIPKYNLNGSKYRPMKLNQNKPKIGIKRAFEFSTQAIEAPVVAETNNRNLIPLSLETNISNSSIPWPPALMEYSKRVYNEAPKELFNSIDKELKELITSKKVNNTLWTTNWKIEKYPNQANPIQPLGLSQEDMKKKNGRLSRFNEGYMTSNFTKESYLNMDLDNNSEPEGQIVGISRELEKEYFRLTKTPDSSSVRSLDVLKKALPHVLSKFKDENKEYVWICSQLKAIRQDLTVQTIRDGFGIKVYETHARIALENNDLGEFNQCQSQLYNLYYSKEKIDRKEDNRMEFMVYRILYFIYTNQLNELNLLYIKLEELKVMEDIQIKFALNLYKYINDKQYKKLFKEVFANGNKLNRILASKILIKIRIEALYVYCKAFRPVISLDKLVVKLGFFDQYHQDFDFAKIHTESWLNGLDLDVKLGVLDTKLHHLKLSELVHKESKVDIKGQL